MEEHSREQGDIPVMAASDENGVLTEKSTTEEKNLEQGMAGALEPRNASLRPGCAAVKPEFLVMDHEQQVDTNYLSQASKDKWKQSIAAGTVTDDSPSVKRKADDTEDACAEDSRAQKNKKIKLKGRNKQRPVTFKTSDAEKMCPAILREEECKFGLKCKFCHDISVFMQSKPDDLGAECYNFKTFGKCPYGFACRYAMQHISSDFKNIANQELFERMTGKPQVYNVLDKDLQRLLWKKKYDFTKSNQIVNSYYNEMRQRKGTDQAEVTSGNDVDKPDSDTSIQTLTGCVMDEEEIKLRPQEKKLVDFSNKLYLAPLTTVGNLPFRRLCKQFGADITCGEMAMATNLLQGQMSEWALLKRHHTEDIFGVQICGAYPDTMTRCAQLLQERLNVDFVDINCGCPIDLIYKRGEGCALMGKMTKFENIIRCMTSVLNIPLTVKMRTGIFDNKNIAHGLIPRLRDAGVSLITLHGRSREQRYTRLADWDYIKTCAKIASPMPLFGNGDILSFEEVSLHKEASGVQGVMIARGALIKPWIFTEIKEQRHWDISAHERFEMLKNFCNYGLEYWGSDTKGVETTRRFLLEWLSFLHRYIPVGLLEHPPQKINQRPPYYRGRSELETLMASSSCGDWIKISEMLLGKVPEQFTFLPKHKANAFS